MPPTERVADATASLQRCLKAPGFLEHFLDLLALRAPHLRECIAVQTGGSQPFMARRCITTVLLAVGGAVPLEEARRKFAECRSSGGIGMTAELFPVWGATLVDAVRRYDPEFGPEVEAGWQRVLDAAGRDVVLCGDPACGSCGA